MQSDITILPDEEKKLFVAKLHTELNTPSVDEEDIYELISNHGFKTQIQIEKAVKAMAYIRLREIEGYTRVDAYKKVFPDRWKNGEPDKTIEARARRLESTKIYNKIIAEIQINFYNVFAIERIAVLNETLRRAYSKKSSEKYQFEYMKLFLENTKKPDEVKQFEVNMNFSNDGASIADIEDKLNVIASKLDGSSQQDIIDAILVGE